MTAVETEPSALEITGASVLAGKIPDAAVENVIQTFGTTCWNHISAGIYVGIMLRYRCVKVLELRITCPRRQGPGVL